MFLISIFSFLLSKPTLRVTRAGRTANTRCRRTDAVDGKWPERLELVLPIPSRVWVEKVYERILKPLHGVNGQTPNLRLARWIPGQNGHPVLLAESLANVTNDPLVRARAG